MKVVLFLIVLATIAPTIHGQDYSIKWSEIERSRGKMIYLLPKDSSEFYALRWSGSRMLGSYQVSRHKDLELVGSARIKIHAEGSIANFEGARVIGDDFVVFLSDKRDGQNYFYMQVYGEDLKPSGPAEKLASYELERLRTRVAQLERRLAG